MATRIIPIDTPLGLGRLFLDAAAAPRATLLLGHGAGGGVDAPDLKVLAEALPGGGVSVARFEQPWRTAGRKVAAPPAQLDAAWRAAVEHLLSGATGLFVGGRSAGARVACRTAPDYPVNGIVCLAFPLHPPGRPERSRAGELRLPTVPRLVLQGSRDAFGTATEVAAAAGDDPAVRIVEIPGADHGFALAKNAPLSGADLHSVLINAVLELVGLPRTE